MLNNYIFHHGDCLDILPTLAAQSVDAVICDPPYGTTACKWDSVIPFEPMWQELKRIIKPRGAIVLFGSQPFTSALVMSNPGMFRYSWVWDKARATGGQFARIQPMRASEDICVFGNDTPVYYPQKKRKPDLQIKQMAKTSRTFSSSDIIGEDRIVTVKGRLDREMLNAPTNVIRIPALNTTSHERTGHPSQKPLALMEYLVKTYTNEGDTVLDFCFGSGTTGAACGNLGRRFIGIEKNLNYFTQASDRIATAYAPLRAMQEAIC